VPFSIQEPSFDAVNYSNSISIQSYSIGQSSLGYKNYELGNHLGNVLATISDAKTPERENLDGKAQSYSSRIANLNDYHPFGMQIQGRQFSQEENRYGVNGKEKEDGMLIPSLTITSLLMPPSQIVHCLII